MMVGKRKYPNYDSMFNNTMFSQGVNYAVKRAKTAGRSFTKTMTRNKTRGVVTTSQRDYKLQYLRKRAPRKVRIRAKKYYKKFIRNSLKLVGTNTVVFNDSLSAQTSALIPQGYMIFNVGTTNGTNLSYEEGNADLNTLISNDTRISSSGKILLKSTSADYTLRNTSVEAPIECDVYEIEYWDNTKENNFASIYNSSITSTPAIGTATSLALNQRGVQLFDFPEIMKRGVRVLKKTKVFLPNGQTATYRLKCKSNVWISTGNDITDNSGFVKRNFTKTLLVVWKPVVGSEPDSGMIIGCTRRYVYKIFEDDRDADALL